MTELLGGLLLAAGVALFILEPVLFGRRSLLYGGEDEFDEAAARRRVALTALRDLEYDRATGKLDDNDYALLKGELSREALKHLDSRTEKGQADGPITTPAEQALEAEIARMRVALQKGLQCGGCGAINRDGSQFCSACGQPLSAGAVEPVEV